MSWLPEQAWFLGSTVMVVSLLLHAATKPYEDALIDWCEFLSLVSTLFIFQSGVVFKVLNDPSNPATGEDARSLASILEWISLLLMFGNVLLGLSILARVTSHVRDGDEDYRVRLIAQQIEKQEKETETAKTWLAKAKAKAEARAQAKTKASSSLDTPSACVQQAGDAEQVTVNPLQDDALEVSDAKK